MTKVRVFIMTGDMFYTSLSFEPTMQMVKGHRGTRPVLSIKELCKKIEEIRPSLKGRPYRIFPQSNDYDYWFDSDKEEE